MKKSIVIFASGIVVGLILSLVLLIKGQMSNASMGRDRIEVVRYTKVNGEWIKNDNQ